MKRGGVHFASGVASSGEDEFNSTPRTIVRPGSHAPTFCANTSYLPAIAPEGQKMASKALKKACDNERAFMVELYRATHGAGWRRNRHWMDETRDLNNWEGANFIDIGTKVWPLVLRERPSSLAAAVAFAFTFTS